MTRLEIAPTGPAALSLSNSGGDFALTLDGSLIYRGTGTTGTQVVMRPRDQLEPRPIASLRDARDFFLSPDGQSIGFVGEAYPMMLSRAAIAGGKALPICPVGRASRGATWGDDDTIIFASGAAGTGLQRVSSSGGTPAILTTPNPQRGEASHFWPKYLPGSQAVLLTIMSLTRWRGHRESGGSGPAARRACRPDGSGGRQPGTLRAERSPGVCRGAAACVPFGST